MSKKRKAAEEEEFRKKAAEIMMKAADGAETRIKQAEQEALCRIAAGKAAMMEALEEAERRRTTAAEEELRRTALEQEEAERSVAEAEKCRRRLLEEEQAREKAAEALTERNMAEEELRRKIAEEEDAKRKAAEAAQDEEDDEPKTRKSEPQELDEAKERSEEDGSVNRSEDETVSEEGSSDKETHAWSPTHRTDSLQRLRGSLSPTSPQRPLSSLTPNFMLSGLPLQLLHVRRANNKTEVREVPLTKDSMNHGDCYVLFDGKTIYTWMGDESSPFEKNACAMHAENLARDNHGQVAEPDARFWSLLGGEGPIRPSDD